MKKRLLTFTVNGESFQIAVRDNAVLLEVLRDDLGLTGVKEGCSEGVCGACTVLLNGDPVRSCLTPALEAEGESVITIEGLAENGKFHDLQRSFTDKGAVQCGFCTSGMILSAKALLDRNPNPNDDDIRTALAGNFCRCTGYIKILDGVRHAASKRHGISGTHKT